MKLIFQNRKRIIFVTAVLLISFILGGCPNNSSDLGPANEEFFGTFTVRDLKEVEQLAESDSIFFSVIRGTTYSIDYLNAANAQGDQSFCNHSGTIFDFGTAKASFVPTSLNYSNCDSASIPRGTFVADFINHGDTIWIYKQVTDTAAPQKYDSLYMIKLMQ